MKKQYILFDFDGVIVNTEPQNAHYIRNLKSTYLARLLWVMFWTVMGAYNKVPWCTLPAATVLLLNKN